MMHGKYLPHTLIIVVHVSQSYTSRLLLSDSNISYYSPHNYLTSPYTCKYYEKAEPLSIRYR